MAYEKNHHFLNCFAPFVGSPSKNKKKKKHMKRNETKQADFGKSTSTFCHLILKKILLPTCFTNNLSHLWPIACFFGFLASWGHRFWKFGVETKKDNCILGRKKNKWPSPDSFFGFLCFFNFLDCFSEKGVPRFPTPPPNNLKHLKPTNPLTPLGLIAPANGVIQFDPDPNSTSEFRLTTEANLNGWIFWWGFFRYSPICAM